MLNQAGYILHGVISSVDTSSTTKKIDGVTVSTYKVKFGIDEATFNSLAHSNLYAMMIDIVIDSKAYLLRYPKPQFAIRTTRAKKDQPAITRPAYMVSAEISAEDFQILTMAKEDYELPVQSHYCSVSECTESEAMHRKYLAWEDPDQPQREPEQPVKKIHRTMGNLKPVTQAVLLCKKEAFWEFLNQKLDSINPKRASIVSEGMAVTTVRHLCRIESRAELGRNEDATERWSMIYEGYNNWFHSGSLH